MKNKVISHCSQQRLMREFTYNNNVIVYLWVYIIARTMLQNTFRWNTF